jgi:hypothetical protein
MGFFGIKGTAHFFTKGSVQSVLRGGIFLAVLACAVQHI